MKFGKMTGALAGAALMVGLVAIPATTASAATSGYKACGSTAVPYVQIQSTGTGQHNHAMNGSTVGHWNNGSTSQTHFSQTGKKAGDWKVFLSGQGGKITYSNAVCYG